MRPSQAIALTLLVGVSLAASVPAQSISTATNPVGFTTVAVSANTIRALALPFNKLPDYAAAVTSVNSGALTITTTGAGWNTAPQAFGPFASNPHVIRMVTGSAVGRQFRIASNTTDTLTLNAGTDLTGVAAGDQYQIFASETLATLFGATGTLNGQSVNTNADPAVADNVLVRIGTAWNTYYNDGTQWKRQGTGAASNNIPVTPEQGFVFVHRAGTAYNFTALGAVPITNLKTDFAANSINSFGNRFPVDTTLSGLGLHSLAGWNKNADPAVADNVLIRVGTAWNTYYHDGTNWLRQGTNAISNTVAIPTGTSVVVVHRAGGTITLNQTLPYTL